MANVNINVIRVSGTNISHESITHVGNSISNWEWTREQVIKSIELGTNTFYVIDAQGKRSQVGVIYPKDGRAPYLRSYADAVWNDNLLSLPKRT